MSHKQTWYTDAKELRQAGLSYAAIGSAVGKSTMRVWSVLNPERRNEHQERWLEKRPGYKVARDRSYKEAHPEQKAKEAEYMRELRKRNPEFVKRQQECCRRYGREHKEERAAYRQSRLPEIAADASKRRAQKRSLTVPGMEEKVRAIYRQARENKRVRCYLCGELIPLGKRHVDHIMPLSKGGPHTPSNLAVSCAFCNESKGAKIPAEVGVLL